MLNLSRRNVDHNVARLYITMDDTPRMNKIEGLRGLSKLSSWAGKPYLEELEHVVLHVEFVHASEKDLPISVVDVLHDEAVVCA